MENIGNKEKKLAFIALIGLITGIEVSLVSTWLIKLSTPEELCKNRDILSLLLSVGALIIISTQIKRGCFEKLLFYLSIYVSSALIIGFFGYSFKLLVLISLVGVFLIILSSLTFWKRYLS